MNQESQVSENRQESRKHHYVPRFLLKPWSVDGELKGYWWNSQRRRLECKRKGPKAFCFEIDLLQLKEHQNGRDVLEHEFFGSIDMKGAIAREHLLEKGPEFLDNDRRCDFARLLLSLEYRQPTYVQRLRNEQSFLANAIDRDSKLREAMNADGITLPPSAYAKEIGIDLEDKAIFTIQYLVDSARAGDRLINFDWRVIHLRPGDGTLVLSDRPLVRLLGLNHPKASWFLPLSPRTLFFAAKRPSDYERVSPQKLAKELNYSSAGQSLKYVFCEDNSHTRWLRKHLSAR